MSAVESADHKLDPNYAVVVSFLELFGHCIVQNPLELSIENLDTFILNKDVDENDTFIKFQLKLLAGIGNRTKPEQWEKGLIKFCKDFAERDDKLIVESGYEDIPVAAKLRILKNLCEDQFEYNNSFNVKVNELLRNEIDGDVIRHMPAGSDRQGRMYWYMTDKVGNVRLYRGVRDVINNKETWTLVCSDPDELKDFIDFLQTYNEDTIEDTEFTETSPAPSDKLLFSKDLLKITEDEVEEILEETKDPKQIIYKVPKARTATQIQRDETKHKLTHCFVKMLENDKTPADKSLEILKEVLEKEKQEALEKQKEPEKEKVIEAKKVESEKKQEQSREDSNSKKASYNSNEDGNSSVDQSDEKEKDSSIDKINDKDKKTNESEPGIDDVDGLESAPQKCVNDRDVCVDKSNGDKHKDDKAKYDKLKDVKSKVKLPEREEMEDNDTSSEIKEGTNKTDDMPRLSEKAELDKTVSGNKIADDKADLSCKESQSKLHSDKCESSGSTHEASFKKNDIDNIENSDSVCSGLQSTEEDNDDFVDDDHDDEDLDMKETLMRISELSGEVPSPIPTQRDHVKTSKENDTSVQEKTRSEEDLPEDIDSPAVDTFDNESDNDPDNVAFDEALKGLKILEEATKLDILKDEDEEKCKMNGVTSDDTNPDPFDHALKGLETLEKIIDQGNTILNSHKTGMSSKEEEKNTMKRAQMSKSDESATNESQEKVVKNTDIQIGSAGDNKIVNDSSEIQTNDNKKKGVEHSNFKAADVKLSKLSKELTSKVSPGKAKSKASVKSDSRELNDSIVEKKVLKVELDKVDNLLKVDRLQSGSVNVNALESKLFKIDNSKTVKEENSNLNGNIKLESSDFVEKCGNLDMLAIKKEASNNCSDKEITKTKSSVNSTSKIKDENSLDSIIADKSGPDLKKDCRKGKPSSKPRGNQKKDKTKCEEQKAEGDKTTKIVVDGDILEINQLSTDSEDENEEEDKAEDVKIVSKPPQEITPYAVINSTDTTCSNDSIKIQTAKELAKKALQKNMTRVFTKENQGKQYKTGVPYLNSFAKSHNLQLLTIGANGPIMNPQNNNNSSNFMNQSMIAYLGSVGSFSNPIVLGDTSNSHRPILPKPVVDTSQLGVQLNTASNQPSRLINSGAIRPKNPTVRSLLASSGVNQISSMNPSIRAELSKGPNYTVNKPDLNKMVTIGKDGKYYDKSSGKPFDVPQNGKQIRVGYDGKFYDAKTLRPVNLNMSKTSKPVDLRPGATFFLVPTKKTANQEPKVQTQNSSITTLLNGPSYYTKIAGYTRPSHFNPSKPQRKRRGRYKKSIVEISSSSDSDISIDSDKDVDVVKSDNEDSDYDYDTISRRIREAASRSTRRPTKMPSYIELSEDESSDDLYIEEEPAEIKIKPPPPPKEVEYELLQYPCSVCGSADNYPTILTCEECNSTYHMGCLNPPLLVIPSEDWFCPQCEHLMLIETLKEKYHALRKLLNKKHRKENRISQKMFAINRDNIMEVTRSSRARKEVNYDESVHDKMVKKAVKEWNESENEESAEEISKKSTMVISSDESDKESSGEKEVTDDNNEVAERKKNTSKDHKNSKSARKRSLKPKFSDSEDDGPTDQKRLKNDDKNVKNIVERSESVSQEKDQRKSRHSKTKKHKSKKKKKNQSETLERESGNKSKRTYSRDSDFNLSNADKNSTDTEGNSGDTDDYVDDVGKKQKSEEHIYYTSSGRKTNSLSKLKNAF